MNWITQATILTNCVNIQQYIVHNPMRYIPCRVSMVWIHTYWKQKTFEGENIHEFRGFRATRESFLLEICHTHIMLSFSIPWKLSPPNGYSYRSAKVFSLKNSTTNPILHYWNSICTGTTNPQCVPSSTWLCSTVHNIIVLYPVLYSYIVLFCYKPCCSTISCNNYL